MKHALELLEKEPWLITQSALEQIAAIATRTHEAPPDLEALATRDPDRTSRDGLMEIRNGVAVINVVGPLFRRANLFTMISGATSVDMLAGAFGEAVDDPSVRAILLAIDSPGGQVGGINEFAEAIFEARGVKPVYAYAENAASGAYWIASAASQLFADETALLGSIGVVASVVVREDAKGGDKAYEFVSSQSPNKRVDPGTEGGQAVIQNMLDDLAGVFVAKVARNRGVSEETVLSDFGQGATVVGEKAVAVGMADGISSQEKLISGFTPDPQIKGGVSMAQTDKQPVTYTKAEVDQLLAEERTASSAQLTEAETKGRTEGVSAERKRINQILSADEAMGRTELARTIALETETEPEAAKKLLAAAATEVKTVADPLKKAMEGVENPDVGAGKGRDEEMTGPELVTSMLKLRQRTQPKGAA